MPKKLIFVYNANSGILNAIYDSAHKLLNPQTYSCSLCALTYDTFGEKKLWKQFRMDKSHEMEFLHKDEFKNHNPGNIFELPAILSEEDSKLTIVMSRDELKGVKDLSSLIEVLNLKL